MYEDRTGRRNSSGAPDPTYAEAARRAERAAARDRLRRCRGAILSLAKLDGMRVSGGWLRAQGLRSARGHDGRRR
ncbi:hypothetical protein B5G20_05065 [Collinsella sp. An7]|uniref:hypothetical protein n=1 Tax=Collinsella sp. An7 TaxID=1965651 RepID=UPI000B39F940|nr:hypothetical protein [Collinsella sp. An7]OUN47338.1 hypothetical protein B5G20_05065 [Collinsella sp. An7]